MLLIAFHFSHKHADACRHTTAHTTKQSAHNQQNVPQFERLDALRQCALAIVEIKLAVGVITRVVTLAIAQQIHITLHARAHTLTVKT